MKVPSLLIHVFYIAIYKDGTEKTLNVQSVTGCSETATFLEEYFGIKAAPSTVWQGKKKYTPIKFRYMENKAYALGYLNWALNFPKNEGTYFYSDVIDKSKYTENNPIIDVKVGVKKVIY
jgi:hypothetical protein